MSTQEQQDPLAGDQDRFVHPDETRSDEQIAYEEGVKNRLHMSGTDDYDAYWEEYEAIHGKGDDVEETATQAARQIVDKEHAPIQQGVKHGPPKPDDMWDNYHPDDDHYGFGKDKADLWSKKNRVDEALEEGRITSESHTELQKGIKDARTGIDKIENEMLDEEDRKWAEEDARLLGLEDDRYAEPDEDPLAGDVDKWVHPDETKDGLG